MKEFPILFKTEMVRAILDGRKTMTRRVAKQPIQLLDSNDLSSPLKCPYGQVGDKLWVRETFAINIPGCPEPYGLTYKSDHIDQKGDGPANPIKWESPRFMPRWASRILLEITNIRIERLQDITELEATHEGIEKHLGIHARHDFSKLWDSINLKRGYGWDKNPWVWCIKFKIINGETK